MVFFAARAAFSAVSRSSSSFRVCAELQQNPLRDDPSNGHRRPVMLQELYHLNLSSVFQLSIRFLSLEPLPSLNLTDIGWVIIGGEGGIRYRPLELGLCPGCARPLRRSRGSAVLQASLH